MSENEPVKQLTHLKLKLSNNKPVKNLAHKVDPVVLLLRHIMFQLTTPAVETNFPPEVKFKQQSPHLVQAAPSPGSCATPGFYLCCSRSRRAGLGCKNPCSDIIKIDLYSYI